MATQRAGEVEVLSAAICESCDMEMPSFSARDLPLPRSALMYPERFMGASLGQRKRSVNDFLNGPVYSELNMDATRRSRLARLLATRYNGDRGQLIAASGLSKGRISQLLNPAMPFKENAARGLEDALGLPTGYLDAASYANTIEAPSIAGRVPLISWIKAGGWGEATDPFQPGDAEDWVACMRPHSPLSYALRVRGDSMTSPHGRTYPEGCIIFVDPELKSPANGARIIAKLDGSDEVTFKVFKEEDGRVWLQPLNPSHLPIREPFRVLGTVIGKWEDE